MSDIKQQLYFNEAQSTHPL